MTEDKLLLLKRHPVSRDLDEVAVREIADACDLIKCEPGEVLQRANQPMLHIYLIIYGRTRQSLIDIHGNVLLDQFQTAGGQIGGLAASLGEPSPLEIVAVEPTTLLRLEYQKALELARRHDSFRTNFSRMLAETARDVLMKDRRPKRPKLISCFHQSSTTRPLTRKLIKRLQGMGESIGVLSDQADWQSMEDVGFFALKKNGQYATSEEIASRIDDWSGDQRIFVDVDAATDFERSCNLIQFSDRTFWCVTPDNWQSAVDRLKAIVKKTPEWRDRINIVWLLPENQEWTPWVPEFRDLANRSYMLSFYEPPANRSRGLIDGFERVVHQLRGVRIGLALGGGGARGMAHLGVLKVLQKHGIVIDMIAGTSAGAMTGILFASGMEPQYNAECFARDLTPNRFFRMLPNGQAWDLMQKYRRRKFDPMLRKYLDDVRLEQLAIPMNSITVDLIQGEPLVRDHGDATHAITESINVPGISVPINRDGRALVDGGIINNIPANVLVKNGCNVVIAVSVTSGLEKVFASNRPDTPTCKMKSASTLQTLMRTYIVQNVNMNSIGIAPADLVVHVDVSEFDVTEFTRAVEMAEIGAATAETSMPKIKQLLSQVDKELFVYPQPEA